MAEQAERKRGVHWAVQAWVYFHIFMIASWSLPKPPDRPRPKTAVEWVREAPNELLRANWVFKGSPFHYYLDTTGFWQYWNMFSPNPANVDVWLDAEVEFEDGTVMLFKYPRMQDLSVFERYFKERYRKFVENTHGDRFAYKWPIVAQAIAYQSYQGDGNLPVRVTLRRHFKEIKALDSFAPPKDYVEPEYQTYAFFTYMVDTQKIERQVHE